MLPLANSEVPSGLFLHVDGGEMKMQIHNINKYYHSWYIWICQLKGTGGYTFTTEW